MIKAQANPNQNNYFFSLRRAVASLKDCRHPITTQKEANDLKNVGPKIARIIVPHATGAIAGTAKSEGKKKAAKKVAPSMKRQLSSSVSSAAPAGGGTTSEQKMASAKEKAYNKAKKEAQHLELPPKGPWKVILLVDGREHKSKQVVAKCKQSGIPCEERHLPIGDMAWIAQCTLPKDPGASSSKTIEIMIGTIIERKDVSDLV